MEPSPAITDDAFAAFLKCRYKAYLKLRGEVGEGSDYQRTQDELAAAYRVAATTDLLRRQTGRPAVERPPSLPDTLRSGPRS